MAVNIVTGMTGDDHITSHDDRARHAAHFGRGKYVFPVGERFSAEKISENLVRIKDGMCINQGTQMGIEPNDYTDVEIDNGITGVNRHDLICMRYTKNADTGIENASLVVVKGTSGSEPTDPDVIEGNILDGGDLEDDMPLFRVVIEGITITSIVPVFEVFDGGNDKIEEIEQEIDSLSDDVTDLNNAMGGISRDVSALQGNVSTLQGNVSSLQSTVTNHTTSIAGLEGDIDSLGGRMNTAESDINTLETNQTQISSDIEVIQDTLGYKKKNLFNENANNIYNGYEKRKILNPDGSTTVVDNWYITEYIKIASNATYTMSGNRGNDPSICFYNEQKEYISGIKYQQVHPLTFSTPENATYLRMSIGNENVQLERGSTATEYTPYVEDVDTRLTANEHSLSTTKTATGNPISVSDSAHVNAEGLVVTLEPIQSGSGDPSPENIRPISGYDETSVMVSGKNLLKVTATTITTQGVTFSVNNDGSIDCSGTAVGTAQLTISSNMSVCSKMGNVVLSGLSHTNNMVWNYIAGYDDNNTPLFDDYIGGSSDIIFDFSRYPTLTKLNVSVKRGQNGVVSGTIYPQLELGSIATSYEPYTANTYTLQFGDTVYGAEVDFVSGVATVTKGYIAEYAGETLPSTWISDRDVYASGTTPTTGAQVAYELATPYTIQLTPQQIKMLKGNNVLVADGDMNLTYQVDSVVGDVKEWAENEFLPKASETAQHNYSTQEQVVGTWIDGSTLYEKTIIYTNTPNSDSWTTIASLTGVSIKKCEGVYRRTNNRLNMFNNTYISTDQTEQLTIGISANNINVHIGSMFIPDFIQIEITIQYTKTTV